MAVYTHITDADTTSFLSAYDCGAFKSLTGIAEGVENTNYLVETSDGRFILTLYERRVERKDLPFFLSLMRHLASKGLPSAEPVSSRSGSDLQAIGDRPAALIRFVPGLSIVEPSPADCHAMGVMLARCHEAVSDFSMSRPNPLALNGLGDLALACADRADECTPGLSALIAAELDDLRSMNDHDLRTAVVHTDFFPDNVFFGPEGAITGLIDFYFACTDSLVYDLAVCLTAWCFSMDDEFSRSRFDAMLDGYMSSGHLSTDEIDALPYQLRRAALRFLLTRTYDWINQVPGAVVTVKDPLEYERKLRFFQSEGSKLVAQWQNA